MLVSVVIPTYNREDLIEDALNSVFAQNYRPIEVLVVDDGSTDQTESVVQHWSQQAGILSEDFRLRYIRQQNAGGNPARNHGIREAKGNYIAFLDSDDTWQAEKLAKQAPLLAETDTGAVYCGVQHMNFDTGSVLEPAKRTYPQGWLLDEMLVRDVTAQTSAYIVRRDVFQQVGNFDEKLQARQDWDMWIRIAEKYKIAAVPEVLVNFREHTGQRTASNPQKEIRAYQAIRRKYRSLLCSRPLSCRFRAYSAYLKRMGRVHYKHKLSKPRAFIYALAAIISWPFDFDNYAAFIGMLIPSDLRQTLHRTWNRIFGSTPFAIRSH